MADVNAFNVHDVLVKDEADFRPGTFGQVRTIVTFFVGVHGPFRLEYAKADATGVKIQQGIDNQVQTLRIIAGGM